MTMISFPIAALAVDFGGTLAARPGAAAPGASVVAAALGERAGWTAPPGFVSALDHAMTSSREADRASLRQTSWAAVLREAARQSSAVLPGEPDDLAAAVFEYLPDAQVDERAGRALGVLAAHGLRIVLASNTRWPEAARRRTLHAAGIEEYVAATVLSSELGVRKPHDDFYRAVLAAADCPAAQVLFLGDTASKDVDPPRRHGMQAMLVAPVWERSAPAGGRPPRFEDVPRLLKVAGR